MQVWVLSVGIERKVMKAAWKRQRGGAVTTINEEKKKGKVAEVEIKMLAGK